MEILHKDKDGEIKLPKPTKVCEDLVSATPKLHDFIGVRNDLFISMEDVKYVKYTEHVVLYIIQEKTFSYTTTLEPLTESNKEYECYEGPRASIVYDESSEQAFGIILLGDEATVFWEYMCEHYEYLGADPEQSPHISIC